MRPARRKPKLLVLSHFYEPEPNFITADVAAALAAEADVVVVAPHPNYPFDSVYPGTRRRWWPAKSIERGVTVWRLPVVPYHGRSHFRRALCYLSFALPAALLAPFLARRAATVWVYLGPFFVALAAVPFKMVGARLVYTVADLWPESLVAAGVAKTGPKVRALLAYRRLINRLADSIICSTRGTLECFAAEGVPRERLHYVPVWVAGTERAGRGRQRADTVDARPRNIVYAGNMGPAQKLDTVVFAAEILQREGVSVTFDLFGDGSEEVSLRSLAAERGLRNVEFHGRVSPSVAFEVSAAALGQIVALEPSPLFAMTIPSKLPFSCAAGAPLLYGLVGESAALAAASGGGIPFDAADPASLASAVKRLLGLTREECEAMSGRLRRFYAANFEAGMLLERTRSIITSAEAGPPAPGVGAADAGQSDGAECRM